MNAARWGRIAMAVALLGVGGLTVTQFASTQETASPKKAEPSQQKPTKVPQKDGAKETLAEGATPGRKALSKFMRMKLDASQKVLAGLALEDFELIQEGAETLEEMSAAEKWRVSTDPVFRQHSADFQRMAQRLVKNGKDEKLEASALVWLEMTMQCIECHKWSRTHLMVDQPK